MTEQRGALSFDSACLDLARHFYPDFPEHVLATLAQELQTVCEDFVLIPPGSVALNAEVIGDD